VRREAVTALVVASALACLSRPAFVPQLFTIEPPPEQAASPAGRSGAVAVRRVRVAAPFDGRELVYRIGPYRLERDPYAMLAASPAALLAEALRSHLRQARLVREDGEAGAGRGPALLLDVDVRELSGDFVHPERPEGVIVVAFEVFQAGTSSPLFRKVYARRTVLGHRTADAVVAAWNQGLAEMLRELERDLDAALSGRSAPNPPPGR
jgi:uncharacterized lipoprotein YmbA